MDRKIIDADAAFPEGPRVVGDRLYYVQYGRDRISVRDGETVTTFWEEARSGPAAVAPLGEDFAVARYDGGHVAVVGRDGRPIRKIRVDADGAPLISPNDFAPDGRAGLYFTTSGPWESGPIVGKVYHQTWDGPARLLADDLHFANGLALSPSGDRLFVAESAAGRIVSFAVGADRALSDRRLFVRVARVDPGSPRAYPDGIKFGPDGNLLIGRYSQARIVVVSPEGALVRTIDLPSEAEPNCRFRRMASSFMSWQSTTGMRRPIGAGFIPCTSSSTGVHAKDHPASTSLPLPSIPPTVTDVQTDREADGPAITSKRAREPISTSQSVSQELAEMGTVPRFRTLLSAR